MTHRTIALSTMLALLPFAAHAQDASPKPIASLAEISRAAVVPPATKHTFTSTAAPQPARQKDSLLNGVLIGAGLGAIVGALGGTTMIGCDECAGFNVPLTFGVVGAAAGAGIGAGLDALRHARARMPRVTNKHTTPSGR
jgi:hypothetical protein